MAKVIYGAENSCTFFAHFEVKKNRNNVYEIKAKAFYPKNNSGEYICFDEVHSAQASLEIENAAKGKHYLQFYNKSALVKTDTVVVN